MIYPNECLKGPKITNYQSKMPFFFDPHAMLGLMNIETKATATPSEEKYLLIL